MSWRGPSWRGPSCSAGARRSSTRRPVPFASSSVSRGAVPWSTDRTGRARARSALLDGGGGSLRLVRIRQQDELELRLFGRFTLLRFGPRRRRAVDDSGTSAASRSSVACSSAAHPARSLRADPWADGRAPRHDRRLLPSPRCQSGPSPVDRRALSPGTAAAASGHQPPLLPTADRRHPVKVVVLGATGTVGRRFSRSWRESTRSLPSHAERQSGGDNVTWARADVSEADRWRGPRRRRRRLLPRALARRLATSSAATALPRRRSRRRRPAAGVRQIVYLGGLGDDDPDLSPHLRSRSRPAARSPRRPCP